MNDILKHITKGWMDDDIAMQDIIRYDLNYMIHE